jgi:hypothetical protein
MRGNPTGSLRKGLSVSIYNGLSTALQDNLADNLSYKSFINTSVNLAVALSASTSIDFSDDLRDKMSVATEQSACLLTTLAMLLSLSFDTSPPCLQFVSSTVFDCTFDVAALLLQMLGCDPILHISVLLVHRFGGILISYIAGEQLPVVI